MTEPFRDSFRASADIEAIGRVHEVFERLGERRPDLPERLRGGFELAVVEVVTNVVTHSQAERPVQVELIIRTNLGGLEAVVIDDAPPAEVDIVDATTPDPEAMTESGRGLALVNLLVDRFEHAAVDGGNRWTLSVG
ncbi:ATP-binding protein [Leifsonia sp. fls2-241-R2A-40a]|uniref:ATP-binding protein n=1 Tax=Leifsonia sp. fls2-241-R2A-40a TaxID=3040290 RepID=UPI00254B64B3|nr:ATP-binding protein [Leifsonia sp. fls2-241-R2A-40a]